MLSQLKKITQSEQGCTCCLKLKDVQKGYHNVYLFYEKFGNTLFMILIVFVLFYFKIYIFMHTKIYDNYCLEETICIN